ncbi:MULTISPECIES: BGTF surface domain-containing protein [Halorussus]|uniref:DUF7827 domain-containing protein n=1 Tax=Halorussus TaxID=1070314 RepID=UPI0013B38D12|nr:MULTISPECIES: BGTF surface domain-containing protein [Halorussus]NHN61489.1 hypothetical protein [Halorussus sp. JP-T4]
MTRTRTSVLLTALLVVSATAAGVTGAAMSNYRAQDDGLDEVAVDSGETFWQGQFLQFSANETNASEVWEIRRVQDGEIGPLATQVLLDATGSATFSTGPPGEYVIVDANGRPVVVQDGSVQGVGSVSEASFEVAQQTLNATFADETVVNDDSENSQTDLRLQSNRADYNFSLQSDQLSASELAEIFPDVEVQNDRAVSTRTASDDGLFDASFTDVEPGTYNVTVVAAGGNTQDTATVTVVEPVEGTASLSNGTFTEQRGDVVEFNVTFDGAEQATVTLGSQDVGYESRFTVADVDGDGVATVRFNSYLAGISPDSPGISVVGEDNYTDFELLTDPTPGRLDAATYPIQVSVGQTRTAVGSIALSERSTGGIQVWTAPDAADVDSVSGLAEVATQDQDVAYQDWAVVEVQASGLYGYVQNISDLDNNETGVSMNVTRLGEINVPDEQVPLQQGRLFVDESGDRFFFVVDSNALEANATYHATFNLTAANPYVEPGNETSLETNFTVVPRDASFDQPVEVPPSSDATISGNSTLAPGSELTVEAANVDDNPFLKRQTATVSEDGTWEATFDFSDVPADTNFTASITELDVNATGQVVGEGAGAAAAEQTTTAAAQQTTAAEETPAAGDEEETTAADGGAETTAADGAAAEETATEMGAETTAAADDAAAEETTTTVEANAPAPGFGPVAALLGLAVLLAGGALATRRR